jgi:bifunctional enzyme CysN/CysC
MTALPNPADFSVEAFLRRQEEKSLLRFITCGSVDDGKSTLIGRLLYEANSVFEDQLKTLEKDSRKWGADHGKLDFALLVDGLAAEREQGITIDVAYRFFSTEKRKFIVADTPGHEQYTRNMATGASTADLAVILVDARKGLTQQSKRHSLLVSMLGVRHAVLAINKMDLVGWDREVARRIEADYRAFARRLDLEHIVCVPLSAKAGDNVIRRSENMGWYQGPTLLEHLDTVEFESSAQVNPFRMSVQLVNRANSDFRGFAGSVVSGVVEPGMPVRIWPSGRETRVARIVTSGGDLDRAVVGQEVTLTLTDEIDISRGDIISGVEDVPITTSEASARLFWMGEKPLDRGRSYFLKIGAKTISATIEGPFSTMNFETMAFEPAEKFSMNAAGDAVVRFDRAIPFDPYSVNRETGAFILIDRESYDTVAMGILRR